MSDDDFKLEDTIYIPVLKHECSSFTRWGLDPNKLPAKAKVGVRDCFLTFSNSANETILFEVDDDDLGLVEAEMLETISADIDHDEIIFTSPDEMWAVHTVCANLDAQHPDFEEWWSALVVYLPIAFDNPKCLEARIEWMLKNNSELDKAFNGERWWEAAARIIMMHATLWNIETFEHRRYLGVARDIVMLTDDESDAALIKLKHNGLMFDLNESVRAQRGPGRIPEVFLPHPPDEEWSVDDDSLNL